MAASSTPFQYTVATGRVPEAPGAAARNKLISLGICPCAATALSGKFTVQSPLASTSKLSPAQSLQTLGLGGYIARTNPAGLAATFRAWRVSLLAGSMGAAASLAWFTAYAMQGAAAVRTLGMVEVLFSYIVSRRVFSESLSPAEKLGMGLVLLGLVLICLQA